LRCRWARSIAILFCGAVAASPSAQAAFSAIRVAISGQVAPGAGSGTFSTFSNVAPTINDYGEVAFLGKLNTGSGVTSSTDSGIWVDRVTGGLELVAREGSVAGTGAGSAVFAQFDTFYSNPQIDQQGNLAFIGSLLIGTGSVTASNDTAAWRADAGGSLRVVARENAAIPELPSSYKFSSMLVNLAMSNGRLVFKNSIAGTTFDNVAYHDDGAGTLAIFRGDGFTTTGYSPGYVIEDLDPPLVTYDHIQAYTSFLNSAPGGVSNSTNTALFLHTDTGGDLLLVREGSTAPGSAAAGSGVYSSLANLRFSLSRNLNVGFQAYVDEQRGGVTGSYDMSVVGPDANGLPTVIAREGSSAPGVSGATFTGFNSVVLVNDDAVTLFQGDTSNSKSGLWLAHPSFSSPIVLALSGSTAPGAGSAKFSDFTGFALNNNSLVLFAATLTGTGVTTSNDTGVWALTDDGQVHLILREGSALTVGPGDSRTLSAFDFFTGSNNGDGGPSSFSDTDLFVFRAAFTDGSAGIFVIAIPEPSATALLLLSAGYWGARRQGWRKFRARAPLQSEAGQPCAESHAGATWRWHATCSASRRHARRSQHSDTPQYHRHAGPSPARRRHLHARATEYRGHGDAGADTTNVFLRPDRDADAGGK
jgi:hypothetical protein